MAMGMVRMPRFDIGVFLFFLGKLQMSINRVGQVLCHTHGQHKQLTATHKAVLMMISVPKTLIKLGSTLNKARSITVAKRS